MPPKRPVIRPIIPVQSSATAEQPPAKKAKKTHIKAEPQIKTETHIKAETQIKAKTRTKSKAPIKAETRIKAETHIKAENHVKAENHIKAEKSSIPLPQPVNEYNGTVDNSMIQLVNAVSFLKGHQEPISLKELAIRSDTALLSEPVLLERFKSHDRVLYDKATDLYLYRHDLCFENKIQLLTEIKRHSFHTGGVPFKAIKEASKDGYNFIKELEKDGEILVSRTERGQQINHVFWNEVRPNEEEGGIPMDEEFQHLWKDLKVPESDADLLKALESEGIDAVAVQPVALKPPGIRQLNKAKALADKKKSKQKQTRPTTQQKTNTHMKDIDLSQDYIPIAGP